MEGIVEEQEQYSRRNCVRVWMDQKEEQADNTDDIIISVAKKMDVDVKMDEICRSHRVGRTSDRRDAKLLPLSAALPATGLNSASWEVERDWKTLKFT